MNNNDYILSIVSLLDAGESVILDPSVTSVILVVCSTVIEDLKVFCSQ